MQISDQAGDQLSSEFKELMSQNGYHHLKVIPGRGVCGISSFIYTIAIVYGLTESGYSGRYCYPNSSVVEILTDYTIWDGKEDPRGQWIKHKGSIEYTNPNYKEDEL